MGTYLRKFTLTFEDNSELAIFPEGYEKDTAKPVIEIPPAHSIVGIYGRIHETYIYELGFIIVTKQ